jgi:hypothetical protein
MDKFILLNLFQVKEKFKLVSIIEFLNHISGHLHLRERPFHLAQHCFCRSVTIKAMFELTKNLSSLKSRKIL